LPIYKTLPAISDMKKQIKSIVIICSNLLIVILTSIALYDEYKRIGKFQWVDQNAIEDYEEMYLTLIFVTIAILGLASIIYEILKLSKAPMQTSIPNFFYLLLKMLNCIYGIFLLIVSWIFIFMTLGNIGNHDHEKGFVFSVSIFLFTLLSVGILGGFIIYNDNRNKNSR